MERDSPIKQPLLVRLPPAVHTHTSHFTCLFRYKVLRGFDYHYEHVSEQQKAGPSGGSLNTLLPRTLLYIR